MLAVSTYKLLMFDIELLSHILGNLILNLTSTIINRFNRSQAISYMHDPIYNSHDWVSSIGGVVIEGKTI